MPRNYSCNPRYHGHLSRILFCLFISFWVASSVFAQTEILGVPAPETTTPPVAVPEVVVDAKLLAKMATPLDTINTFKKAALDGDKETAIACLDFSEQPGILKNNLGWNYVTDLYDLVFAFWEINPEAIENIEHDEKTLILFSAFESVQASPEHEEDAIQITLSKDSNGFWKFSSDTVAVIESLRTKYDTQIEYLKNLDTTDKKDLPVLGFANWLRQQVPPAFKEVVWFLPNYQWIFLVALIILGFVADFLTQKVMGVVTLAWFRYSKKEPTDEERKNSRKSWRPVGHLMQALVWYFGLHECFNLPANVQSFLLVAINIFAVVAAAMTAFRLVDLLSSYLAKKALKTKTRFDDLLVPIVARALKAVLVCVAIISIAEIYDFRITGLIGGLGLGGIAIALAAKDTLNNVFGSFTVMLDRPFEIGDWIITDGVEGSVEKVGLRSTRIRTFYNSVITVPNSLLITAKVDNMGRRRYRRIKTYLNLQYNTTPEQIDAFCEGVRELLRRHPFTRKDYYHVYLNQFNASSLDILLYCFLECPDWNVELRERHRLFIDIMKLAKSLHVEFAFPTQTLHMFQEQESTSDLPESLMNDPISSGQRHAAEITGSTDSPENRRGLVQFGEYQKFHDIDGNDESGGEGE
ncbi:MAG: mechanosensitive ion channel family protein [Pirellulales bacterium]